MLIFEDKIQYINAAYGDLMELAKSYNNIYVEAEPFPNIVFRNFFDEAVLSFVLEEFEDTIKNNGLQHKSPNQLKTTTVGENHFGDKTKAFIHYLNSEPFLKFLKALTGIEEVLITDPFMEAGGLHEVKKGGFMKIHTDFNKHPRTKLDLRLNVLVYLNKDWRDNFNGQLEFWDKDMERCVKKVTPEFNSLVVFSTTDMSYHGLPTPIDCPKGFSRKSICVYYYSNGRPAHEIIEGLEDPDTRFKPRKGVQDDMAVLNYNNRLKIKKIVKNITPPVIFNFFEKLGRR